VKILGLAALLAALAACASPGPSPADLPAPTTQPTTTATAPTHTSTFQPTPAYPVSAGDKDAGPQLAAVVPRPKVKPAPPRLPVVHATRRTPAPHVVKPAPAVKPPAAGYANCTAVRAAGKAPLYRGQPGYASHLDLDNDGIACE
jgi:hypothetical protein